MPRDRFTDHQESYEDDAYWIGDDEDESYDGDPRAVVGYESRYLAFDEDLDVFDAEIDDRPDPLIIPGAGLEPRLVSKRRSRPLTMQLFIASVTACIILSALFSFSPLRDAAAAGGIDPWSALARTVDLAKPKPFFEYKARSGDTFESIARRYNVQLGGIYELNNLFAGDDAVVGNTYKIPTDPTYGASYVPPLPAGYNPTGAGQFTVNIPGSCNFCAIAGKDNGPDGICAPGYALAASPKDYGLIRPNPGDPTKGIVTHWVRGFTAFHSGADTSTGREGQDPIVAAQDGVVIYADFDPGGGGYTVKINHCGGLATSYSHMVEILPTLNFGTVVHKGDTIGTQGNTGNSTGAHLHFMTWWKNIPFDPLCAYPNQGDLIDGAYLGQNGDPYGGCPPDLIKGTVWYP